MQNIRVSINLLQIAGARTVKINNPSGAPEIYVAIPVSQLFVPADKPLPRLMATMIHTPNAQYGDFMIKPYLSNADYKMLSKEEQQNLPILGKGTFMQADNNKILSRQANAVEVIDVAANEIPATTATQGPAAPLADAPSPANGGSSTTDGTPSSFFVLNSDAQSIQECSTLDDAVAVGNSASNAIAIEEWNNSRRLHRWVYNPVTCGWDLDF